uniref:CS domain-containing protein n=1 Tax=Psilocybe cubensis TaxID=181762 RepID=A0A8H8CF43_PSICU
MTSHIIPSVFWAQKSSETTDQENLIRLSVNIPDIATSCLKCTTAVLDKTLSFRAYPRESLNEAKYAFDLVLYSKVDSEAMVVRQDLPRKCLVITLKKVDKSSRDWPRLQNDEEIPPFVKQDPTPWTNYEEVQVGNHQDSYTTTINLQSFMNPEYLEQCGIFFLRKFERFGDIQDLKQSILNFEESVKRTPDEHEEMADRLNGLACALQSLFDLTGDLADITKAISTLEDAVRLAHEGDPNLPNIFSNLGILHRCRFKQTKDLGDIDHAVEYHTKALNSTSDDHPRWLNNLVISYEIRFNLSHNLDDLDFVISHFRKMEESCPPSNLPNILTKLGNLYADRFNCTQDINDIDLVVSYHRKAVDNANSNKDILWRSFINLAIAYRTRSEQFHDVHDINLAISFGHQALDCSPHEGPTRLMSLEKLASSYHSRFKNSEQLQDADVSIDYWKQVLDLTSADDPSYPSRLHKLGNAYVSRFELTGSLEDIEAAISYHQKTIDFAPSGHPDLPSWNHGLGFSYTRRFERSGNLLDLDLAIACNKKAADSTHPGHEDLSGFYNGLGHSYGRRFERTGDLLDIDSAISYHKMALECDSSTNNASLCANLGTSYLLRFNRTGDFENINSAISYHEKAVKLTPSNAQNLAVYLSNLGRSYLSRFERTGDLEDNNRALMYNQKAVQSTPPGHSELTRRIHNLGDAHLSRFMVTGDLQDIDYAISYHQKGVDSMPSDHPDLSILLCGLGYSYRVRFEHSKIDQDINHSISYHHKAVDFTPPDHAEYLRYLNLLANAYDTRFRHSHNVEDIDTALILHHKVIDLAPAGHAVLPNWLNNLGTSYELKFDHTQDLCDIDNSIAFIRKALDCAPKDHTARGAWLGNLGNAHGLRFKKTCFIDNIDLSISYFQQAIDLTPATYSILTTMLYSLGISYACRFELCDSQPDIQAAIQAYRKGANAPGTPSARLDAATKAAFISFDYDREGCLSDFSLAIDLLSEVAALSQTISRRHYNLQGHSNLIRAAAGAALDFGRLDLALEWLEQGRCLVWSQINQLRTPIDDLKEKHPNLADRFLNLAKALEHHGTRKVPATVESGINLADDISLQSQALDHTLFAAQYKSLLSEIRSQKNFERFLLPAKAAHILASLPAEGPVIIFNISRTSCDALALVKDSSAPLHVPLTEFDIKQAEALQKILQVDVLDKRDVDNQERGTRRRHERPEPMRYILKELWQKIVWPIIKALGYTASNEPLNRRRIWWCPVGPLAFLPLHAAGIYGSEYCTGSNVRDYVVSSYTPSVRFLLEKMASKPVQSTSTDILLISQPDTPGLNPIPSVRKETHDIQTLFLGTGIETRLLEDTSATKENVMKEMVSHNWVHFACHGVQDHGDALSSGLCLYDGRLGLLDIMQQNIPNKDLAFLSACQTSKGDDRLSEEAVHTAAGMLSAGYRGVVSTMWNISDAYGPRFAIKFYEYIVNNKQSNGNLDCGDAAFALDYATKQVQQCLVDCDSSFSQWVPYVHFGY